jgi:catechol 2,3-dioxygenase-like lactoylglutathione lyase family enzyme
MAKIKGINHIAFVVKDLEEALHSAVEILGGEIVMRFEETNLKYVGACVQFGQSIVSFFHGTDPNSFVTKFVQERGEGIQHIGLEIDNIEEYIKELEGKGVRVDKGHMKDVNFQEALVGPKIGHGVVLQLMQWKGGPMDLTPEGKERLKQKYREVPGGCLLE